MNIKKLALILFLIVGTAIPNQLHCFSIAMIGSKIVNSAAFHLARKICYTSTLCGIGYTILRYLNDQRNATRTAQVQFTPGNSAHEPTLTINTDGLIVIQSHNATHGFECHTERLDPERQPELAGNPHNRWQQFWQWLVRPAHRTFVRHTVSVPRLTHIIAQTTNANGFTHPHERTIDISNIDGFIDAQAQTGEIYVTNPGNSVTITTPDSTHITDFGGPLRIDGASTIHASRREGNMQPVTIDGQEHPQQAVYDLAYDDAH